MLTLLALLMLLALLAVFTLTRHPTMGTGWSILGRDRCESGMSADNLLSEPSSCTVICALLWIAPPSSGEMLYIMPSIVAMPTKGLA